MRLVAFSAYEEPADFTAPAGAILVDSTTGLPLPVHVAAFQHQEDAAAFIRWLGDAPCSLHHLRELVSRWQRVRCLPACPTCEGGRVEAGNAQCPGCIEETRREAAGQ